MATLVDPHQPRRQDSDNVALATETFVVTGQTDPVRLGGDIVVQISGTATAVTAIVERNPLGPIVAPTGWAPAEDDPFDGDLTAGISARSYYDPLSAFYRVRITSITGGNALVALSGASV